MTAHAVNGSRLAYRPGVRRPPLRSGPSGDLERRQHLDALRLSVDLQATYGDQKRSLAASTAAIDSRLQTTGFRKIIRDVSGRSERDRQQLDGITGLFEDATVTVTLSNNALRLIASWARAQNVSLDACMSELLEGRAQEDLRLYSDSELVEISASDWRDMSAACFIPEDYNERMSRGEMDDDIPF